MKMRLNFKGEKGLMLLAFLMINSVFLKAQHLTAEERAHFEKGRYHQKTGWVNSIGFYTGNWNQAEEEYPENFTKQYEYLIYKLVKPRLGIGGGVALKYSPTRGLVSLQHPRRNIRQFDSFKYYKFAEIFAYTKSYLTDRRSLYVDARIGYAQHLNEISHSCYDCKGERSLYERYSSGPTMQTGIGLERIKPKAIRAGIKLSYYQNFIHRQIEVHPDYWVTTSDGIIKRESSSYVLKRLMLGVSLYF